ncbi:thioredoxin family protein [Olivibacter sp. SA151]|uniref:thioredoxin family protein n=1 Tax=Olivibacter jilunii TaxID=985016 RepID=UPI003F171F34
MKKGTVLCLLVCTIVLRVTALFAVPLDTVSFDRLPYLQQKQKRLVLILIGTDWCRYCRAMEHYLGDDWPIGIKQGYYFLQLNAEQKEPIKFNKKTFHYNPNGASTGLHSLASYIGADEAGKISFPTICILNEKNELLFRYNGFLRKKDLQRIMIEILPK